VVEEIKKTFERLTGVAIPKAGEIKLKHSAPLAISFEDDGRTPNNVFPLIVYRQVMEFDNRFDPAAQFEVIFSSNGWKQSWRNGMYSFIHFHTQAHEVLGVARGRLLVQFGGSRGDQFELTPGDVVIIPAGVGHKRLSASSDILIVGAYAHGGQYDERRPGEISNRKTRDRIARVPLPEYDPLFGKDGQLLELWRT